MNLKLRRKKEASIYRSSEKPKMKNKLKYIFSISRDIYKQDWILILRREKKD